MRAIIALAVLVGCAETEETTENIAETTETTEVEANSSTEETTTGETTLKNRFFRHFSSVGRAADL